MTTNKACPGCGNTLHAVALVGVLQTCCARIGYALCVPCAQTMQHGTDAARTQLARIIEMTLIVDEDKIQ
jgi:uncharacterized protein (UPF0212 family)